MDTNAIVSDYWLRSKRWRLLLSRAEKGLIELYIPDAVVVEAVRRYRLDLEQAAQALSVAKRQAGRVLPGAHIDDGVDIDDQVDVYEEHLRDKLAEANASLEYPTVDAGEIAQMAISRAKPFKADGSGYVDALVWLHTRELAQDDEVALISANHKDFGGDKHGGLHGTLESQLADRGLNDRVTRYPTPSDFHADALDRAELYDAEIREEFDKPEVRADIERAISALLDDREARDVGSWGSAAGADQTFFVTGEVTNVELSEVTDAEPEYGYATFEASATATYEFPVLYGEAWEAYEEGQLDDLAVDEEEIVGTASRTVDLELMVDAQYDPGTKRLTDFELTSAEAA